MNIKQELIKVALKLSYIDTIMPVKTWHDEFIISYEEYFSENGFKLNKTTNLNENDKEASFSMLFNDFELNITYLKTNDSVNIQLNTINLNKHIKIEKILDANDSLIPALFINPRDLKQISTNNETVGKQEFSNMFLKRFNIVGDKNLPESGWYLEIDDVTYVKIKRIVNRRIYANWIVENICLKDKHEFIETKDKVKKVFNEDEKSIKDMINYISNITEEYLQ